GGLHRCDRLTTGDVGLRLADPPCFDHALEHVVAPGAGAVGMLEGVVALRVVDQPCEHRCLTYRQLFEPLPSRYRRAWMGGEEEPACRRLDAVRPLAEVHSIEVLVEELPLRVLLDHPEGEH